MADSSVQPPHLTLRRRSFVCGLSGCVKAVAQQRGRFGATASDREAVVFESHALDEILRWAQSESMDLPTGWRSQRPYELAREQAQWNGRSDPSDQVLQQLNRIRQRRGDLTIEEMLERTRRLRDTVLRDADGFLQGAVPHIRTYLPARTPIRGVVAMGAFLPNYAFSMNGTIVVSLTDRFWRGDAALVFNLLIHELFHNGFVQHQRSVAPNDATDGSKLFQALLWQIQNEGLATYVAYRTKPPDLVFGDYELLRKSAEVTKRFAQCRSLLGDIHAASAQSLSALRERLWRECNVDRLSYLVGATMADRIEQRSTVSALANTVKHGPSAFLEAYQRTSPSPELSL
jgi:hypothetical protein